MSYQLRGYQLRDTGAISAYWRQGIRSVQYQLPTGGGKTLTAADALKRAFDRGKRCLFICNRIELLEQTVSAFTTVGLECGIIAAGYSYNPFARVQIASIDTLKRRTDKIAFHPDFIVWDECRFIGAAGWTAVYNKFPNAYHLGLDASPIRLDGKGLGKYFGAMVCGPTYKELQAMGYLVPFRTFAPSSVDLSGVKISKGEYDTKQISDRVDKPSLVGDIVSHWGKFCRGRQGLTFAVSRIHSEHLAAQYRAAGVNACHLDGDTPKHERKAIVAKFRQREIDVLTNVDLFTSGYDQSGVSVITMGRPTCSLAVFLQQCGRGSRPEEGKRDCLLLDHANNVAKFGLPDQDREWSLTMDTSPKKKAGEKVAPARQCPMCYRVHTPSPTCPECGHPYVVEGRKVKEVAGDLVEISAIEAHHKRTERDAEIKRAKTLGDFEAIAARNGYKRGWAFMKWKTVTALRQKYQRTA